MRKLICDLCGKETDTLHDIEIVFDIKRKDIITHTYREEKREVCSDCKYQYRIESHKALEKVYKKLKKVK